MADPKQTAHTPTPWKWNDKGCLISPKEPLYVIAQKGGRGLTPEGEAEVSANHDLIVRAVNSHDKLVEALEAITQHYRNNNGHIPGDVVDLAEAALRAAKGGNATQEKGGEE